MTVTVQYIIRTDDRQPPRVNIFTQDDIQFRRSVAGSVNGLIGLAAVPCGAILPYGGSVAPPGFLICDGAALARKDFPALYGALGTAYGAGDGATTFNIPDMRGVGAVGNTVTPDQTITGAAVVNPDPVDTGAVGGSNTNIVTGGRAPRLREGEREP